MNTQSVQAVKVQEPLTFLKDLLNTFSNAKTGDIVWVQSMLFEPGKHTELIVNALCTAKANGAIVYALVDSFGILTIEEILIRSLLSDSKISPDILRKQEQKQKLIDKLKNAEINFHISGNMGKIKSTFPFVFCNHRKSYGLINKKAKKYLVWITGINIADSSFSHFDIAVKIRHENLVKTVFNQFLHDYYGDQQRRNHIYNIDNDFKYLVENNSNCSIIRSEAYALIDRAESFVRFITQYPPDPLLLKKFVKRAKQGVVIEILTSHKDDEFNYRKPFNFFNANFNSKLSSNYNIKRGYFPGKVHAKLLYSEKESLVGSDNISVILKILQAKENMLYVSHNSYYTSQLESTFEPAWHKARKV